MAPTLFYFFTRQLDKVEANLWHLDPPNWMLMLRWLLARDYDGAPIIIFHGPSLTSNSWSLQILLEIFYK